MRKVEKAAQLDADCIVMDLEDGVAFEQKVSARQVTHDALTQIAFGKRERLVRLNSPRTALFTDDFRATVDAQPDGYVIPKVEDAGELQAISAALDVIEHQHEWQSERIRLLAVIESARGVINLREIAASTRRLDALMFGAEDFAADVGARRTVGGEEVLYARSSLIVAAAAFGLQAIDIVCFDLQDMAAFERECAFGRQLGYSGKMAIHPRQLEPINRIFAPSADEIAHAQRVVTAAAEAQSRGLGAFALDGRMVDQPVIVAAEKTLQRARAANLI